MTESELEKLRFPIGKPVYLKNPTENDIKKWIGDIEALPARLREAVRNLTPEQLETPYRPKGWTLRQVVHHIGDSHMNGIIRFKLALTEYKPTIKPYPEDLFAELFDYKLSVEVSLNLIEAVHTRWVELMKNASMENLNRSYIHPADQREYRLVDQLCLYAWHSNHHLAHITTTCERLVF